MVWVIFRCNVRSLLFLSEEVGRPVFVEQKIGHYLFEFQILVAKLVHFARFALGGAFVLAAPPVKRGLRDAQLATYLHGWRPGFDLPERLHNLVLSEFAWSHRSILHAACAP
jgi:hypothetical protein